jgi:hypothetical protein
MGEKSGFEFSNLKNLFFNFFSFKNIYKKKKSKNHDKPIYNSKIPFYR